MLAYPTTPDGRYFVVRGRLWRCTNPHLPIHEKQHWTSLLMAARRAKGLAMRTGDRNAREQAKLEIETAKVALGERGAVWWTDGAPDLNRHMVRNTPYATWYSAQERDAGGVDHG